MEQLMLFPTMESPSTSLSAERHVNHSPRPVKEKVSEVFPDLLSTMSDYCMNWLLTEGYVTQSTKTFQACCRPETQKEATTPRFFRLSPDGTLIRPKTDGEAPASYLPQARGISGLRTGYSMYGFAEWTAFPRRYLKDAGASSLSSILETGDVPLKYYLSSRACSGIIHRSEVRGKACPPLLAEALVAMIDLMGKLEGWMATMPKADVEALKDTPLEKVLEMYRDAVASSPTECDSGQEKMEQSPSNPESQEGRETPTAS